MRGQLVRESHEIPEWLLLGADETLLFSAETDRHVRNPVANVAPTPEAAILTDRRLICLARIKTLGMNEPVLTTMPLSAVQVGAHVNVVAGNLRTEIKFHPEAAALLEKFLEALDAAVSFRRTL